MSFSHAVAGLLPVVALFGGDMADALADTPETASSRSHYARSHAGGSSGATPPKQPVVIGKKEELVVTATGLSRASSATKTRTPIIESPQTISIVNREEIELRASPTIADALSYTAGVQAEPSGIDSRVDEVSGPGVFLPIITLLTGCVCPQAGSGPAPLLIPLPCSRSRYLKARQAHSTGRLRQAGW